MIFIGCPFAPAHPATAKTAAFPGLSPLLGRAESRNRLRLQLLSKSVEDGFQRRHQLRFKTLRNTIDPLHRPLLDLRNIQSLLGKFLADGILITIDEAIFEGFGVD